MLQKIKFSLSILCLIIISTSCTRPDAEPESQSPMRLVSWIATGVTYVYSYDADGRLSKVSYVHAGKSFGEERYTYAEGKISQIKVMDLDGTFKLAIQQNYTWLSATELRCKETFYKSLSAVPLDVIYTIDPLSGQVQKEIHYIGDGTEISWSYIYTRDIRGNIIKTKRERYDKGQIMLTSVTEYSFDDHPNPQYKMPSSVYFVDNSNPNNCISQKSQQDQNEPQFVRIDYEYNQQGYPTKKMYLNNSLVSTYHYESH